MNKSELIDAMAANAGISKASAKMALESFLGSVTSTLKGGGRVSLVGFGSWSVSQRAARDGRNPQTGATIKIPAKKVVKFKALQASHWVFGTPSSAPLYTSDKYVPKCSPIVIIPQTQADKVIPNCGKTK